MMMVVAGMGIEEGDSKRIMGSRTVGERKNEDGMCPSCNHIMEEANKVVRTRAIRLIFVFTLDHSSAVFPFHV